jgi:RNA polymerase sigma-70 factor (ECF subfamily)
MAYEHVAVSQAATEDLSDQAADARFKEDLGRHISSAYRLASVILGSTADAEDVTHDAVERAWRARKSLREPDRFEAWFQRIVVNACRDRVRSRRARPALLSIGEGPNSVAALANDGPDPFAATLEQDAIRRAFVRLNVDQRAVIAMRFYLDLEIDEIARRLGARQGTIKSRLHRALRTLRDAWEKDE